MGNRSLPNRQQFILFAKEIKIIFSIGLKYIALPPVIEFVEKKIVSKYNFFGFIDKIAIFSGGGENSARGAAPPLLPGWLRPCRCGRSLAGQIRRSVGNGSPPLRRFFVALLPTYFLILFRCNSFNALPYICNSFNARRNALPYICKCI